MKTPTGKIEIPPVNWFLSVGRDDVAEYLKGVCSKYGDLWWYKESPVENAVTLVSHIDTTHEKWGKWDEAKKWCKEKNEWVDAKPPKKKKKKPLFYDQKHRVFWSPVGLGADDRAGVFTTLHVYNNMPDNAKPNLLFCDEEESGGGGARAAVKDVPELKSSLMFVELDRKGSVDCVFYNEEPKGFIEYIESFGFKKSWGSFSDISVICRELDICGANLSVGYEDEHVKYEHLYVNWMIATYQKTMKIVEDATRLGKQWSLPKKKPVEIKKYSQIGIYDEYDEFYHNNYWSRKGRSYYDRWSRGSRLPKGGGNGRSIVLFQELDPKDVPIVLEEARKSGYTQEDLERNPYLVEWLITGHRRLFGAGP